MPDPDEGPITQEIASKLLKADLANLMKKLKAGKNLSPGEHARLEQARIGKATATTYTKNKRHLSKALDISPTSLYKYMQRPSFPEAEAAGWPIEKCREWCEKHELGMATNPDFERGDPEDYGYESGAAHALSRFADTEKQLAADYRKAYELGDLETASLLQKQWMEIGNRLRDFERIIDKDKRDAGELLPRTEVVGFLTMIGQAISYAEEAFLNRQGVVIVQMPEAARNNPRQIRQASKGMLYEKINESLDRACTEGKYHRWLAEALAEGLRPVTNERPAPVLIEDPEEEEAPDE